jgi:hypothetical protein
MIAEANEPLLDTTWWFFVSLLVHLTALPAAMYALVGEKPVAVIFTALVVMAVADCVAPGTSSASAAAVQRMSLRMSNPLSGGFEY